MKPGDYMLYDGPVFQSSSVGKLRKGDIVKVDRIDKVYFFADNHGIWYYPAAFTLLGPSDTLTNLEKLIYNIDIP